MHRIAFIRHRENGNEVKVGIDSGDDKSTLTLGVSFFDSLGLSVGDSLCDEDLAPLLEEDERRRCMKRALSILAYADNSKRLLYTKLKRAGYSSSLARECVTDCERLGYIDEKKQLLRLVAHEANSTLRGPVRIKAHLAGRGYSPRDIDEAIEILTSRGEVDFELNFERLSERFPEGTDEFLVKYKYGYK